MLDVGHIGKLGTFFLEFIATSKGLVIGDIFPVYAR
jgi:hypothetical protein